MVHYGVKRAPSDEWVAQQPREATPFDKQPQFLIRDNDRNYGPCFTRVAKDRQIHVVKTPVQAPKANAVCDDRRERRRLRFLDSVRRECRDHSLILSERYLYRA